MPTQKLTEKSIRALPAPDPTGKQMIYWSAETKGFGVLCSGTTGAKTYFVQRATKAGLRRRVTIGACNVLSLAEATERAMCLATSIRVLIPSLAATRKLRSAKRWKNI